MLSLLLLVCSGQVHQVGASATAIAPPMRWAAPVRWLEQGAARQASVSPVFVAEPSPSTEGAAALLALDASATVVADTRTLRLWRVHGAEQLLARLPALLPVLHELPSTASRVRVPVGVVCGGVRQPRAGLSALAWVSAHPDCLPDFWYRARLK